MVTRLQSPPPMMTYTQEKIFFGVSSIVSSALFGMGAILSEGHETRWIYVTLACSVITASFLSLIFKKVDETMRIVVGRSGMSILGGIFGSKAVVSYFGWEQPNSDVVVLGGVAVSCCIFAFIIGYALLHVVNRKSSDIANKILDKWLPPK